MKETTIRGIQTFLLASLGLQSVLFLGAVGQYYILYLNGLGDQTILGIVFFLSLGISSIIVGLLIDKIKKTRQILFFSYVIWGTLLLISLRLTGNILFVFYCLLFLGIFSAINIVLGMSFVNSYLKIEQRGYTLGKYLAVGFIFFGFCTLTRVIPFLGLSFSIIFVALTNMVVGIINFLLIRFLSEKQIIWQNPAKIPKDYNVHLNFFLYYLGVCLFGVFLGIFLVMLSVPDDQMRVMAQGILFFENIIPWLDAAASFGLPFIVFAFGTAAIIVPPLTMLFGWLMDRKGRKVIFQLACFCISVCLLLFMWTIYNPLVFILLYSAGLATLVGIYFLIIYVIWPDLARSENMGRYCGIGYSSFVFGVVIGIAATFGLFSITSSGRSIEYLIIGLSDAIIAVSLIPLISMKETLPPVEEMTWYKEVLYLYILTDSGLPIYNYSFEANLSDGGKTENSRLLFTGGITGVAQILREMTESHQKINVIDHQDKKLLFEYGESYEIVLISNKMLKTLRLKLENLNEDIKMIFGPTIKAWSGGDMFCFIPIKGLIEKYFLEK